MNLRALLPLAVIGAVTAAPALAENWNPRLAADYLDSRQKEWFAWPAAKAPGGPCVSCHTGVTYLLARPALRRVLDEKEPTSYEAGLGDALRTRVEMGLADSLKVRKEPRASEAIGVEAILAALFLTLDKPGAAPLSAKAERAFERLWSLQIREGASKGAWSWFDLNLDPYEMPDSRFYGASLAALAVSSTPREYQRRADVRQRIDDLTAYLTSQRQGQPLHNRLMLLWASAKFPAALPKPARKAIVNETWKKQQPDGSWTIEALGPWTEHPAAAPSTGGSTYATAVGAFTLTKAGVRRSDPRLARALDWLRSRQDPKSGAWPAESMNKRYEPGSMQAGFMQDAATAFSALALVEADLLH